MQITCTDCSEEYNQEYFKTCPRCYCASTGKYGEESAKKFYWSKMKDIEKVDQEIEKIEKKLSKVHQKKRKICQEIRKGVHNRTSTIWEVEGRFPRSSSYRLKRFFTKEEAEQDAKELKSQISYPDYSVGVKPVTVPDIDSDSLLVMEKEDGYISP